MSIEIESMKDFQAFVELNGGEVGLPDYMYANISANGASSDLYIGIAEFFCPSFIEYEGCYFIEHQFSEKKFGKIKASSGTKDEIEFWMNLTCIDCFFENSDLGDAKARDFAHRIAAMWRLKLKSDFPDLSFEVRIYDELDDVGDLLVSFQRVR